MKHIQQYTEHATFQKFVKTSKRDGVEDYSDKSSKRNGYSKQRSFKRDMWSVE
jgi:hypothetical protein